MTQENQKKIENKEQDMIEMDTLKRKNKQPKASFGQNISKLLNHIKSMVASLGHIMSKLIPNFSRKQLKDKKSDAPQFGQKKENAALPQAKGDTEVLNMDEIKKEGLDQSQDQLTRKK